MSNSLTNKDKMAEHKNNTLWYVLGAVVIVVLVIVIFYVNSNKSSTPTCNKPYILVGNSCCLDQNNNGICDTDEQTANTNTPQSQQQSQPQPYCGDGVCSATENTCSWSSTDLHYEAQCPQDCGHNCPAYVQVAKTIAEVASNDNTYRCDGYNDGNCVELGNNNFRIIFNQNPYKYTIRGISTTVENQGESQAQGIQKSFKCYSGNSLVMSNSGDTYNGVKVDSYFYEGSQYNTEKISNPISILYSVYPPSTPQWYYSYYLDFEIDNMQQGFDLTCDVTLTSQNPVWSNTQTIKVSFIK